MASLKRSDWQIEVGTTKTLVIALVFSDLCDVAHAMVFWEAQVVNLCKKKAVKWRLSGCDAVPLRVSDRIVPVDAPCIGLQYISTRFGGCMVCHKGFLFGQLFVEIQESPVVLPAPQMA